MVQEINNVDTLDNIGQKDPYIRLASGDRWHFLNPRANIGVPLETLLWGLSNITRFTGQAGKDYDVLRHSWVCYQSVLRETPDDYEFLTGVLFHDIAEAVMGDVASPLKALLKEYREIYKIQENFIITNYQLPPFDTMEKIHRIDKFIGDVEGEYFIPGWNGLKPPTENVAMLRAWIRHRIADSIKTPAEELINNTMEIYNKYRNK